MTHGVDDSAGISGGHAVITYGYATATKQWNVSVYDPYDGVRHTGVASGTMYGAGFNNHELVWQELHACELPTGS